MLEQLQLFFFRKVSPKGLGIFRIAYCISFLFEIITIFNYRQLFFDKIPYINIHFPDTKLMFLLWMMIVIFIIFGLYTRILTVFNYIFTLVFISSAVNYEYHMFYAYTSINFLLMFLPIQKALSLDVLRKKIKYINQGILYKPLYVSKINYLLPVFIGVGLVYFDSVIFYKIQSPMWLRGLGLWLPSSLPQVTISDNQWVLNQEFMVKFLSYLTMTFEFMFIFIFWNKKFRIPLSIIGIGLHIGIYIEYPIPYFAFGCMSVYLLMIPISMWDKMWNKITSKKERLVVCISNSNLNTCRLKIIVESLDIFNQIKFVDRNIESESIDLSSKLVKEEVYGIDTDNKSYINDSLHHKIAELTLLYYPVIWFNNVFSYKSQLNEDVASNIKSKKLKAFKGENLIFNREQNKIKNVVLMLFFLVSFGLQMKIHYGSTYVMNKSLCSYFGICIHPVFMDFHFAGYTNIYGLKYKNRFLPLLDEKGMPGDYISGGTWVNYIWRVNRPYVKENAYSLRKGFMDYSSFWAHQNNVNLSKNQEFVIVRKKIKSPFKWEKDLLKNNIESPWEEVGKLIWKNRNPQFFWNSSNKSK